MTTAAIDPTPVAYSYVRFSHPDQAKGDSLRRQTEAAADWCRRHNVRLDESTTLHDLGKSAYTGDHRKNADRHALAAFLKLVEAGKVPRGSYLIIENLDRLSREHIQPALLLALNLLQAGVRVVQLKPSEIVFDDQSDTLPVMMMMMELSRGHGESAIKSERVRAAWAEKKKRARQNGDVITHRLPAWVEESHGKLRLVSDRAAIIKRIFKMSVGGYGAALIVKYLIADKVPAFGTSGHWTRAYIGLILKDRRVLGEFQPRKRNGLADGDPIPDYFPAVVTEEEFHAARASGSSRKQKPGRVGNRVELFSGLLKNARDGDSYYVATRTDGDKHTRVLINTNAAEGRAVCWSFPLASFEAAILSLLAEIDPHEILNGDHGPDETLALAGQLAGVEARIGELEAELLESGDVAALARVLRQLEERKRRLAEKLAEARQKAANPLSEAWGEAQSLLAALDAAPDPKDARLRLRSALRRIVSGIWMLVVPRGRDRLCAVQIWFTGDKRHRDYLIFHRPPKANASARQEGQWQSRSLAIDAVPGELDLRKPSDAKKVEKVLSAIDLAALATESDH